MGLYKRKGVWYVRVKYEGKEIRKSTGTRNRKLAKKALDVIKGKIASGKFDIQDYKKTITIYSILQAVSLATVAYLPFFYRNNGLVLHIH